MRPIAAIRAARREPGLTGHCERRAACGVRGGPCRQVSPLLACPAGRPTPRAPSASTAQSQDVAQVGEAIAQMDKVTQQNAALVEESAAAASRPQGAGGPVAGLGRGVPPGADGARRCPGRPAACRLCSAPIRAQAGQPPGRQAPPHGLAERREGRGADSSAPFGRPCPPSPLRPWLRRGGRRPGNLLRRRGRPMLWRGAQGRKTSPASGLHPL